MTTQNQSPPSPPASPAHPRAGRKEWIGLAVIALPCLLFSVDVTVLNVAVPHIVADLHPSSAQLLWIVDIYGFFLAASLITMGVVGDRIGRRRLLLIGSTLFTLGSLAAAFSETAGMLIAARAFMGIAAATLAPSTLSLVRNMFHDGRQRAVAMSIWIACMSVGGASGPLIAGVLLNYFWWGSVFLVAVPIMLLLLVLGPRFLPEHRDPNPGRLDLFSAGLSIAAILPIIYGIQQLAQNGPSWTSANTIVLGLVIGGLFVLRQRRLANPLIDISLFGSLTFSTVLTLNIISFFVNYSTSLFVAQYLQSVLSWSALKAGGWMAPSGATFMLGALLTPLLARRFRLPFVAAGGFAVAAFGLGLLALAPSHGLALLLIGLPVFTLGLSPVITLAVSFIVSAAPPERAGAAAGVGQTSSQFGGALGVAVLGSIGTVVYRHQLLPSLPATARHQLVGPAQNTIGSSLAAAKHLPATLGSTVATAARHAFSLSFTAIFIVSSLSVLTAALAAVVLGRRNPSDNV